jgi:hypothetical protein
MKKLHYFTPIFACIVLFYGCDTEQSIPAYLYIPDVKLQAIDSFGQGASSSKIVDAWVYANDNLVGGFRVPATVPIIADGNTRITVLAGVAENGNFTTPTIYPFYDQYNTTINLKPTRLDTLRPVVKYYRPLTNAPKFLIADFENDNKFMETIPSLPAEAQVDIAAEVGNKYGRILFDGAKNETFCAMTTRISPDLTQPVWVELDYKGTNSMAVGLIGYNDSGTDYRFKTFFVTKNSWNKLYVSLGREMFALKQNSGATKYQLVLYAKRANSSVVSEVNIDNVKILYY